MSDAIRAREGNAVAAPGRSRHDPPHPLRAGDLRHPVPRRHGVGAVKTPRHINRLRVSALGFGFAFSVMAWAHALPRLIACF